MNKLNKPEIIIILFVAYILAVIWFKMFTDPPSEQIERTVVNAVMTKQERVESMCKSDPYYEGCVSFLMREN